MNLPEGPGPSARSWQRLDLVLVEEREEDADPLDDRGTELGVELDPVVVVPALDQLDLLLHGAQVLA